MKPSRWGLSLNGFEIGSSQFTRNDLFYIEQYFATFMKYMFLNFIAENTESFKNQFLNYSSPLSLQQKLDLFDSFSDFLETYKQVISDNNSTAKNIMEKFVVGKTLF